MKKVGKGFTTLLPLFRGERAPWSGGNLGVCSGVPTNASVVVLASPPQPFSDRNSSPPRHHNVRIGPLQSLQRILATKGEVEGWVTGKSCWARRAAERRWGPKKTRFWGKRTGDHGRERKTGTTGKSIAPHPFPHHVASGYLVLGACARANKKQAHRSRPPRSEKQICPPPGFLRPAPLRVSAALFKISKV